MSVNDEPSRLIEVQGPHRSWGLLVPACGYGSCYRCRSPWWLIDGHIVRLLPSGAIWEAGVVAGQHAVCTRCWPRMTTEDRIEAHKWVTWVLQGGSNADLWEAIVEAVKRES